MKFNVIQTGGKQYKVAEGDVITVEKLPGEYKEGAKISFDEVLLTDDGTKTIIGDPVVKGAKVEAEFVEEGRAKKIDVIRYKSKSRYFKKRGHRQPFMKVRVTKVA